jgi:hypothetical protein
LPQSFAASSQGTARAITQLLQTPRIIETHGGTIGIRISADLMHEALVNPIKTSNKPTA